MTLTLDFRTIPDPTGHTPALRLKGDWLFVVISDGRAAGLGEATHSGDDGRCRQAIGDLFDRHVKHLRPSFDEIRELEAGPFAAVPDFLHATAVSAVNQALYDLLARREGVPVWRLFTDTPVRDRVELYATINRCLVARDLGEYREVVSEVRGCGFRHVKCAPFDGVTPNGDHVSQSKMGLDILRGLRSVFPDLSIRVDFHGRFTAESFFRILPELDELRPHWIEEPFELGPRYADVRGHGRVAAGELSFGVDGFRPLVESGWADVILPDVKHVGGFGPLLRVCALAAKHGVEVSPHNPSGPISTVASLHAAALSDNVTSLEIPFDRDGRRKTFGEPVCDGYIVRTDTPGWGIELPENTPR